MDLKGKRLLLVGGAGLIGSHTIDALLSTEVESVVIYDNFSRGKYSNLKKALSDPRVKVFELGGDILQVDILEKAMKNVDGVFHFAAMWLLHCQEFPQTAFDVNIRGTFNVIEACIHSKVKRLVYSSSASVYGDAEFEPMEEDHPFNNKTFYGATKISSEALLRASFYKSGLPFVGLRYMNVYGPRQDDKGAYVSVISKILRNINLNEPILIHGDGKQCFDFVYVSDCARANVLAMQAETKNEFYNVATGVKTSITNLIDLICRIKGCSPSIKYVEAERDLVRNRIGSTQKAAKELGFVYEVGLEAGLRKMICDSLYV